VTLTNSTVSGNTADASGGGVKNQYCPDKTTLVAHLNKNGILW
jgi:hypothetical protein